MDQLPAPIVWLWTLSGVKFITTHTGINFVVAVMAAVRTKKFKPHKLAEFLTRKLLPYVIVYGSIKVIGVEAGLDWLTPIIFGIIETTLLADLTENLATLGIPMPEKIKGWVTKKPRIS